MSTHREDTNKVKLLISLSDSYQYYYPDSGFVYGNYAHALAEKLDYDAGRFWSIVSINRSLYVLGNYTLELEYAFKAIPIAAKLNFPYATGWSNGMLGDCYYNLGDFATSLKYYRIVIRIVETTYPAERYSIYSGLVPVFVGLHQYDSALIYATKAHELFKQDTVLNNNDFSSRWAKSGLYTLIGDAFAGMGYHDSALAYYRRSLTYSESVLMELNKISAYNGIAKLYMARNNDSTIWYAGKVLNERISPTFPAGTLKAATLLSEAYELKKVPDSTIKYLHMAVAIKDSLFNKEKMMAFQNIIFREREKQNEIEAAKLKLKNEYRTYLIAGLLLLSIIIGAAVFRNRRIKQLQKIRNGIADDLHDDIGSTLSSISIMNELAKAKSPEALPLLSSIGESAVTLQENMSDIVWAINSKNDNIENIVQRMQQFASEITDLQNTKLTFSSHVSNAAMRFTMEQRKNFYLFFKEAINNAVKYANAGNIFVSVVQKNRNVELKIRDDGKGFDTTKASGGNGMNTLRKRAAELKGEYEISSEANAGTTVELRFKIT